MYFVLGLLAIIAVIFASDKVRPDLAALCALVILVLANILSPSEAFAAFSNPTVIMVAALFVVGDALSKVGVSNYLGNLISRQLKEGETNKLTTMLVTTIGLVGSFMSSTGIVALFVPIVQRIAHNIGVVPKKIFLPVAYAGLISGMMLLISTPPNLIVAEELSAKGFEPLGMLAFLPLGLMILVIATLYFAFLNKLKAKKTENKGQKKDETAPQHLLDKYGLDFKIFRFRVTSDSKLLNKNIAETKLRNVYRINVMAIEVNINGEIRAEEINGETLFKEDRVFYAYGREQAIERFCWQESVAELEYGNMNRTTLRENFGMAEVIIPFNSSLVGKSISQIKRGELNNVTIIASQRKGNDAKLALKTRKLVGGETLLVWGSSDNLNDLKGNTNRMVVLNVFEEEKKNSDMKKAPFAIGITLMMIVLLISNWLPPAISIMMSALAMVATGCISAEGAYRSINWQTVMLIAAMLPFSVALEKTGSTDLIASGMLSLLTGASPIVVMGGLFMLATLMSMFISNTATAVILAPIAVQMALQLDISPYPLAVGIAISCSAAFLTPVSSPVNMLVVTPGGYQFKDFIKSGLPLWVITFVACLILIPLLYPF